MNLGPSRKNSGLRRRDAKRRDPERRRGERKWTDPAVRGERHAFRPGEAPRHGWSFESGSGADRAGRPTGERRQG